MIILHLLVVVLTACELRFRSPWLRILLVIFAMVELQFAAGLGPAYRRAIAHPQRVVMPAPQSLPQQPASEFASGVLVMEEEARKDLVGINFPLGVLVWFALYPVVLPAVSRWGRRPGQSVPKIVAP
jgi:hypothetical protein